MHITNAGWGRTDRIFLDAPVSVRRNKKLIVITVVHNIKTTNAISLFDGSEHKSIHLDGFILKFDVSKIKYIVPMYYYLI